MRMGAWCSRMAICDGDFIFLLLWRTANRKFVLGVEKLWDSGLELPVCLLRV